MNKPKPLVSILLPVRNCAKFLPLCLKSLTHQSFRNIEIIAIDDYSKDNSFRVLKEFAKKDKRIRIYKNVKKYGMTITLNRLIKKAKAGFIAFMRASDIAKKNRIKNQIQFVLRNPQTVAVGSQCIFIDKDNKRLGKSNFPHDNHFIYQSPLHGVSMQLETVLINSNLLPKDVLKFNFSSKPFIYSDFL